MDFTRITVQIAEKDKKFLSSVVESGDYMNISEAVRAGIRCLMRETGYLPQLMKREASLSSSEPSEARA